MKAYVVVNVGRFPPGPTTLNVEDPVVVKVELVTPEKSRADAYMAAHPVAIEKIATEIGEFNCLCQRGVYEAEFEIPEIGQELFRPKPPTPPTPQKTYYTLEEVAALLNKQKETTDGNET